MTDQLANIDTPRDNSADRLLTALFISYIFDKEMGTTIIFSKL